MSEGKKSPWRAIGLVSIVSSYVVGGVVGGVLFGVWLGNIFGAKPFFIIFFLLCGLGSGFYGVFRTIQPFIHEREDR